MDNCYSCLLDPSWMKKPLETTIQKFNFVFIHLIYVFRRYQRLQFEIYWNIQTKYVIPCTFHTLCCVTRDYFEVIGDSFCSDIILRIKQQNKIIFKEVHILYIFKFDKM